MAAIIGALEFKIPGKPIEQTAYAQQQRDILIRVRELCGWNRQTFPGSQPVSLSNSNVAELGRSPYVACEKTDGVRYLLLATSGPVLLIDRKETVQVLEMCLPVPQPALEHESEAKPPPDKIERHDVTLLDGELVQDRFPDGKVDVSFLVYDMLTLKRDKSIAKMNLMERLKRALLEVVRPRAAFEQKYPEVVTLEKDRNNFMSIYLKDFYEVCDIMAIRNFSTKRLPHLSDGIIFTPVNLPYVPGTCPQLLKWKPPELNTVDFAAQLVYSLDIRGNKVPVGAKLLIGHQGFRCDSGYWIVMGGPLWDQLIRRELLQRDCDGSIWECYFDTKATTIVPRQATGNQEADEWRKSETIWTDFWKRHLGETARRPGMADRSSKAIRKNLDLINSGICEQEMESPGAGTIEFMGRPPVSHLAGFPADVCPLASDQHNAGIYDFSQATAREGGWLLERIRTDKETPNDERVMHRVQESIEAGISISQLFNTILGYARSGMKPVHSLCEMPEYYPEHGSRVQNADMRKYAEQAEATQKALIELTTSPLRAVTVAAASGIRSAPHSAVQPPGTGRSVTSITPSVVGDIDDLMPTAVGGDGPKILNPPPVTRHRPSAGDDEISSSSSGTNDRSMSSSSDG